MFRALALIGLSVLAACTSVRLVDADTTTRAARCEAITMVGISPSVATLRVGDSLGFTATFHECEGGVFVASAVRWSSSDTTVATVDSTGLAHARTAGHTTIVAMGIADPTLEAAMVLQVTP